MPLKKCMRDGKEGWKWGDEGTCYLGPSAKNKALRQGVAVEISKGGFKTEPSQVLGERDSYQETYNDYPKAASENARKALEWIKKYGRDVVEAGTRVGLARANQLANGEPVSRETIGRMAAFDRHRKNSVIDPKFKGKPWLDKGYVAWLLWGGTEGVDWAIRKMKQIDKEG